MDAANDDWLSQSDSGDPTLPGPSGWLMLIGSLFFTLAYEGMLTFTRKLNRPRNL